MRHTTGGQSTDETASHSTRLSKDYSQVVGYVQQVECGVGAAASGIGSKPEGSATTHVDE